MKYRLFVTLYTEAMEYNDLEMYIAERGWQEWMDNYNDAEIIANILENIYNISRMDIKQLRDYMGISQVAFINLYDIKRRTEQGWEYGDGKIPDHTKKLIAYTAFMERM